LTPKNAKLAPFKKAGVADDEVHQFATVGRASSGLAPRSVPARRCATTLAPQADSRGAAMAGRRAPTSTQSERYAKSAAKYLVFSALSLTMALRVAGGEVINGTLVASL
jgi:hypothetical protein